MRKPTALLVCVTALVVVVTACSASAPASPASGSSSSAKPANKPALVASNKPAVAIKAGVWKGTGDNGSTVTFTISDTGDGIKDGIRVTFNAICGTRPQQVSERVGSAVIVPVQSGDFKYVDDSYELVGRGTAPDLVEGVLRVAPFSMGKVGSCDGTEIKWTASPQ